MSADPIQPREKRPIPMQRNEPAPQESLMPSNKDAEAALVACALLHPGAYEACSHIKPEHFYDHNFRAYWKGFADYTEAEGESPDLIALEDWMRRTGGANALEDEPSGQLMNRAPNWMKAPSYAKIVFRTWRLREIIRAAGSMAGIAYTDPDADSAYAQAEKLLQDVGKDVEANSHFPLLYDDEAEERESAEGILGNILYENTLAILYGQSGRWKSFVALAMGMSLATGIPFAGRIPQRTGPVIYVAAEGGGGMGKRITAWKKQHRISGRSKLQTLLVPVQLLQEGQVEKFVASVKTRVEDDPPLLVVLDTLSRNMAGGDENAGKDGSRAIEQADKIRAAFGCCVLIVAHPGKDDTRGIRGWSGYFAAADTVMKIAASHNNPRLEVGEIVKLISEKPKDDEPFIDMPLTTIRHEWVSGSGRPISSLSIVDADASEMAEAFADVSLAQLSDAGRQILNLFTSAPGPKRPAEMRRMLPSDIPERTFYHNVKLLVSKGMLAKDDLSGTYDVLATRSQ